jgi:predicted ribosomally synthesized peptide with nif11-like leader
MTQEKIDEFFRQAEGEASLRDELDQALARKEGAVEAFLAVAAARGFQFTAQEFVEALSTWQASHGATELKDEELAKVAGGAVSPPTGPTSSPLRRMAGLIRVQAGPGSQLGGGAQAIDDEEHILL